NRVGVSFDGEREQAFGLPSEHFVGHPLERLAEHYEATVARVAGAQVQVAEPTAAAPVSPLAGQHNEVKRVRTFELAPGGAAIAGFVGSGERLHEQAFVPSLERL